MPTIEQWRQIWRDLNAGEPEGLFEDLLTHYRQAHRHYHTLQHLDECLTRFAEIRSLANHAEEIELAIWFHDAVYDTRRADNERLSAQWAYSALTKAGLGSDVAERVQALIMSTSHTASPQHSDAQLIVDVDLAILGAAPERFAEYERQIREEYAWVNDVLFRSERSKIIKQFLARQPIYNNACFRQRLETQAVSNLQNSLQTLSHAQPINSSD